MPNATTIYLTRVEAHIDGDTRFPALGDEWTLTSATAHPADDRHAYSFEFQVYERADLAP